MSRPACARTRRHLARTEELLAEAQGLVMLAAQRTAGALVAEREAGDPLGLTSPVGCVNTSLRTMLATFDELVLQVRDSRKMADGVPARARARRSS